ncbi:glycosyltransferase family 2 protein [Leuconostoc gasicomitatum]|uniref:glycosyltransferase family 2 protein n=1 Tax=Leuconostoc gasicomitatum TaxID=115778 RepID=UPI001CC6E886|nr:glycosyltransferase family 2 protein [Leuconostoc gasicomitatum]MBZ5987868.1 glycosyltransferase family 2 protein [Leuconostoc gasicomitatum]MBZ5989304.1 glycosyltransferase family 2 protein [Leuconostoc gasicomitatum]
MISIIIPVYNSEKTLGTVIKQLIQQTSNDFEVVFVDDASTDNSVEIIKSIDLKNLNYQYICQKNEGVSSARNKGISYAKGQYLMFVDPDDEIEVNFIEKGIELINDADLGIMGFNEVDVSSGNVTNTHQWHQNKSMDFKIYLSNFSKLYNSELLFSLWNKVYRLDIVLDNQLTFSDIRMGEDFLFNMQYFDYIKKIKIDTEVTYHYLRYNDGTATTNFHGDEFYCNYKNQKYMVDFLIKHSIYDENLVSLHWSLILGYRFADLRKLKKNNDDKYGMARQQYFQILRIYENEKLVQMKFLPLMRRLKYFVMKTNLNRIFI